jgi:phenylacetaldehyde dehydrogenase
VTATDQVPLRSGVAGFLETEHGPWIDDAETTGGGDVADVLNPATGGLLARVRLAVEADVDAAVAAARRSFEAGDWRGLTPDARASALWRVAELVERDQDALAELETLDNGKPLSDSANIDLPSVAANFRYYAGWATKLTGRTNPVSWPQHLNYTVRQPAGVCGVIIPWNFPVLMASRYLAPALAAGNSVVLKPAEETPLSALWLARLLAEAGIPPGVVNVIPGAGEVAGARLAGHPDVDKVSFTGGHEAARAVLSASAVNFKRLSLELGGKNPQIVFGDVVMDDVLDNVMAGGLYNCGQNCAAGSRIYVQRPLLEEFRERSIDHLAGLRVGPGWRDGVDLGPIISAGQLERISGFLAQGSSAGAQVTLGGGRPDGVPPGGYFMQPTLVDVPDDDNVLVREEIFGPVVALLGFDDVDEIVARGNDTRFGLTAGIWTRDIGVAHRLADQLRAGTVWVNGWDRWDPAAPFGGVKQSGYGHSYGPEAIEEFTVLKSVWINYSA